MKECKNSCAIFRILVFLFPFTLMNVTSDAQFLLNSDSAFKAEAPNSGRLWGYAFGDYYYKAHADTLNRGGANQYTGILKGRNEFQFRRIYLGYDYNISKKFAVELLLAAEDNTVQGNNPPSGDLLADGKLTFYIKLANVRWKNIWKGTDLVVGQLVTPAFSLLTDRIWGHRAIERTIADIRRTPSFDLGASLQGVFDSKGNYGYNVMVGNGSGAKPEGDNFKWFYADVFAKFLDKRLVFDLYADYERQTWIDGFHHARNMIKGFVAYTTPAFTAGAEAFINNGTDDVAGMNRTVRDTLNAQAAGISVYVRGNLVKNKLGYFARVDSYNPYTKYDNRKYTGYTGFTSNYEPNNKEQFVTAGFDFTPIRNVHFMPNVWYNRYVSNSAISNTSYDLVYRMTFYFVFGK